MSNNKSGSHNTRSQYKVEEEESISSSPPSNNRSDKGSLQETPVKPRSRYGETEALRQHIQIQLLDDIRQSGGFDLIKRPTTVIFRKRSDIYGDRGTARRNQVEGYYKYWKKLPEKQFVELQSKIRQGLSIGNPPVDEDDEDQDSFQLDEESTSASSQNTPEQQPWWAANKSPRERNVTFAASSTQPQAKFVSPSGKKAKSSPHRPQEVSPKPQRHYKATMGKSTKKETFGELRLYLLGLFVVLFLYTNFCYFEQDCDPLKLMLTWNTLKTTLVF
jgi:hypothetical protein